ncbi:MAG: DNA repair protein RecO [Candidatus Aminicenantales bacterium]
MPLQQSEAIVLRSFNVGELDKIIVFFTRSSGILRGIAKGARKFGSRFGSSLEPMSLVNVFYYEKEGKDLVTVSNCDLLESFFEIQKIPKIAFTLSYFAELVESFLPSRSNEDLLYRLLLSVLRALERESDLAFLTRYFEAWLLKINGILPDFGRCKKCRKEITTSSWLSAKRDGVFCNSCAPQKKENVEPVINEFLKWIKKNPPSKNNESPFRSEELKAIKKTLQDIIIYHLESKPKTLRYLE